MLWCASISPSLHPEDSSVPLSILFLDLDANIHPIPNPVPNPNSAPDSDPNDPNPKMSSDSLTDSNLLGPYPDPTADSPDTLTVGPKPDPDPITDPNTDSDPEPKPNPDSKTSDSVCLGPKPDPHNDSEPSDSEGVPCECVLCGLCKCVWCEGALFALCVLTVILTSASTSRSISDRVECVTVRCDCDSCEREA